MYPGAEQGGYEAARAQKTEARLRSARNRIPLEDSKSTTILSYSLYMLDEINFTRRYESKGPLNPSTSELTLRKYLIRYHISVFPMCDLRL